MLEYKFQIHAPRKGLLVHVLEGVEVRFRKFTEDAYHKATQHGTLASTWVINVSQFCHSYYVSYIVRGTAKGSETSENVVPSSDDGYKVKQ